jgi:hypothetical protein
MRTKLLSVLVFVVLVSGLAGTSKAGFDPSPFRWLTVRLHVIGYTLENIDSRLSEVLAMPPDDQRPGLMALRLNIMAARLTILNSRIEAVLSATPDDIMPPDYFMDAVTRVRSAAFNIAYQAREGSDALPDDERVCDALGRVELAAEDIVTL